MESICVTVSIRDLKLRNRITANCSLTELFVFGEDPFNTSLGSLKFNSTVDRELTNFKPFQRKLNQPSPVKRNSAPFNTPGRQSTQQAKVSVYSFLAAFLNRDRKVLYCPARPVSNLFKLNIKKTVTFSA